MITIVLQGEGGERECVSEGVRGYVSAWVIRLCVRGVSKRCELELCITVYSMHEKVQDSPPPPVPPVTLFIHGSDGMTNMAPEVSSIFSDQPEA